jgi:hypothetical protein
MRLGLPENWFAPVGAVSVLPAPRRASVRAKPTVPQRPRRPPGEWPQYCLPAQTEGRCASVEGCIHNEEIGPRADLFLRLANKFDHCKLPIPGAITLSALWLTFEPAANPAGEADWLRHRKFK